MRTIYLALAATAVGASLAACGAPESPASAPVQAPVQAPAAGAPAGGVVTPAPPLPYTGGISAGAEITQGMDAGNPLSPTLSMTDPIAAGAPLTATGGATDTLRAGAGRTSLVGTQWRWTGTTIRSGGQLAPDDPSHYTLSFAEDGTVTVVADCNTGAGRYTASDPSMTIDVSSLPKAACAAGSQSAAFIDDLGAVNSMVTVKRGMLMLTFSRPDGTFGGMRFEPAAGP